MNKLLCKFLSISVILCMLMQFTFTVSAADLTSKVGYIYNYVDPADTVITGAYLNAENVNADDIEADAVSKLITSAVENAYGGDADAAKEGIVNFLSGTLMSHFAMSVDEFESKLDASKQKVSPEFEKLFGSAELLNDWYDVVLIARKNAQSGADWSDKRIWATGSTGDPTDSLAELFVCLDELQIAEVNKLLNSDYSALADAIDSLGWNAQGLVEAMRGITDAVDNVNGRKNRAEYALIKAACRSTARLTFGDDEYKSETVISNNEIIYTAGTDIEDKTMALRILDGYNVTNLIGYSVDSDILDISRNEAGKELIASFADNKNGIAELILKRDPYRDNSSSDSDWLVKLRFVLAYDIEKPVTNSWSGNVITWKPVEHADEYLVEFYKGDKCIDKVTTNDAKFDASKYIQGDGSYTVKVTAYGTLKEYEVSEASEESAVLEVMHLPGKVEPKPEWEGNSLVITWNPLDDDSVTGYKVYLYNKGVLVDGSPYDASADATKLDLKSYIGDTRSEFTVRVQAVNSAGAGPLSDESDVKSLNKNTVYGTILLEGGSRTRPDGTSVPEGSKLVKKNNSGTIVNIGAYFGETDENGYFEIKNIPDGSYEMTLTSSGYLQLIKTSVRVSGGIVEISSSDNPIVLWYGDAIFGNGIGAGDIAEIISKLGLRAGDVGYEDYLDCNETGSLFDEFSIAIVNAGKVSEDYNY